MFQRSGGEGHLRLPVNIIPVTYLLYIPRDFDFGISETSTVFCLLIRCEVISSRNHHHHHSQTHKHQPDNKPTASLPYLYQLLRQPEAALAVSKAIKSSMPCVNATRPSVVQRVPLEIGPMEKEIPSLETTILSEHVAVGMLQNRIVSTAWLLRWLPLNFWERITGLSFGPGRFVQTSPWLQMGIPTSQLPLARSVEGPLVWFVDFQR